MKFDIYGAKAYCLTLPLAVERGENVQREFERVGLRVDFAAGIAPGFYSPVPELCEKTPGVWGCAAAHMQLLARGFDLGGCMVFEDDVVFCDDFRERVEYLRSLNLEADGFLLGGHFPSPQIESGSTPTEHRHVRQVTAAGGTYAYLFSAELARFVVRNWTYQWGADEFFTNFVYPRFKVLAMVPFLCGTRPNVSGVSGHFWEYPNVGWYYQQATFDLNGKAWGT